MTLADRAHAYALSEHGIASPASHLQLVTEGGRDVAYGRWLIGNDYKARTAYYGAYPPRFLARVAALFPDVQGRDQVLHVFSGSLPAGEYTRCDVNPENGAELVCDVLKLPRLVPRCWRLVIADPPYSAADATFYGTRMVDRRKVLAALADIVVAGGHLAWLDQVWPMHRGDQWATVARIAITRATNHRVRDLTIFQRRAS
jgi:hypothetical protein